MKTTIFCILLCSIALAIAFTNCASQDRKPALLEKYLYNGEVLRNCRVYSEPNDSAHTIEMLAINDNVIITALTTNGFNEVLLGSEENIGYIKHDCIRAKSTQ